MIPLGILAASGAGAAASVAGYVAGGNTGSKVTTVDKFAFPSDSRSVLATGLSAAGYGLSAMANEGI